MALLLISGGSSRLDGVASIIYARHGKADVGVRWTRNARCPTDATVSPIIIAHNVYY